MTPEELRPLLFSIAYRMVGSVAEAEDLVQEAFVRFHREAEVEAPKAFLTTVVTRLAIDHLRSARVRREAYVGAWLPEPIVAVPGVAEHVEEDETLSLAFVALLERLTPVERAVYVLHDLFGYAHDEIAGIVGKSSANCRQILVRARKPRRRRTPALRAVARAPPGAAGPLPRRGAARRRRRARRDARRRRVHYADGGGKARATPLPIYGSDKVARLWAALGTPSDEYTLRAGRRQRPARRGGLRRRTARCSSCSRSTSPTTASRRSGRW